MQLRLGLYVLYKKIKYKLLKIGEDIEQKVLLAYEQKKVRDNRRKKLYESKILTSEQKEKIDEFFIKNYGKKIPYYWHKLYMSYTGNFDEKFFPEFLFIPKLERKWNNAKYKYALEDKNLLPILFNGLDEIKTPKMIVSCTNGIYRDSRGAILKRKDVIRKLNDVGLVFIKPSINSGSGRGCLILDMKHGIDQKSKQSITTILEIYGKDFCVQELIKQNIVLSRLYSQSINTFRVTTYLWKNTIFLTPVVLRIGRGGGYLDNAHQGGMFVGIGETGKLFKVGFTEFQERFYEHPDSGIKFEDYIIPNFSRIGKAAKVLHSRLPQLGVIHWDLTLDDEDNVIVIEMNTYEGGIWLPQMAVGKGAFGDNTAEILQWISK